MAGYIVPYILRKASPVHALRAMLFPVWQATWQAETLLFFQVSVVPEQLVQTASKCKQNQSVDKYEFDDVNDHPSQ